MPETIGESFVNQLRQYYESKAAREPSVNRGHRSRNFKGGEMNRYRPIVKQNKRRPVSLPDRTPPVDNPWSPPRNSPDNLGNAIGEHPVDFRYNLGAFNNVSVIRDFTGVAPNINADVLGSSSPSNTSYAVGGAGLKPTVYDIYVARGAPNVPMLISYAALGLRNFNPALPVTITGQVEDWQVAVPRPQPVPVGCPAVPVAPTIVLEFNLIESGFLGVTYDTGFHYRALMHDYALPLCTDLTCTLAVHIMVIGYEA